MTKRSIFSQIALGRRGTPRIAFFPYKEIYRSTTFYEAMSPRAYVKSELIIGIHLPRGQTTQLMGDEIEVKVDSPNSRTVTKVPLLPVPHARLGQYPPYQFQYPDPYGKEDFFGVLSGQTGEVTFKLIGSPITTYKWYEFSAKFDPAGVASGSVRFPRLKVNGVEVDGPELPFSKVHYSEIARYCP
ncbi:MAG TPA: hypothetical protein VN794_09440 [Methylomirabilota bacterium]|nr:hypothetical protein [Methylomirabilota bacterium]